MKLLHRTGWLIFFALPMILTAQAHPSEGTLVFRNAPNSIDSPKASREVQKKWNVGLSSRFQSFSDFPGSGLTPTLDVYYKKFAFQISPFAPQFYIGISADILDFSKLRIKNKECLHMIAYLGYARSNDDFKPWFGLKPYPDADTLQLGSGLRFTFPDRAFINAGFAIDLVSLRQEYEVLNPRSSSNMTLSAFIGLGIALFPMHQNSKRT